MDAERYRRIKDVVFGALSLEGAERDEFVRRECGSDADLRSQVEEFLQPDTLESPWIGVTTEVGAHGERRRVGPFELMERIGEGGMGTVWRARQTEPVRREVAVKLLRSGLESPQAIARFEAERQALALMDHPCIAKVHEAGTTSEGFPFFAMEYVRGVPITEFCDARRLSVRDRLKLFLQVCEGVHHAHQKAVLHRDLKPSNILVTDERDGTPKIIDFGVAKALAQQLTERTMYTHVGQIVGTPDYMSPEQADLTTMGIDTRSDVYSLGVLLYELLTGRLPFDPKELRSEGSAEFAVAFWRWIRQPRANGCPDWSLRRSTRSRAPATFPRPPCRDSCERSWTGSSRRRWTRIPPVATSPRPSSPPTFDST